MSRSNPNTGSSNPSTRWHEWAGDKGSIKYYDKAAQANVEVKLPFTFILLDETATVKGWHDASESGIYANEVRDTRQEALVVRAFKGGELASGVYASIRDRVGSVGGHFVANLYIAYRDGSEMKIGSLQFKGAALKQWMEYRKMSRKDLYDKAILIKDAAKGKKGSITFYTPNFSSVALQEASNVKALELDKELQEYLKAYFSRTKDAAAQVSKEDLAKADAAFAGDPEDHDDAAVEQEASRAQARAEDKPFVDDDIDSIPF